MKKLFNSKKNTSREERILRSIRPLPGEDFQRHMAAAPWNETEQHAEKKVRSRLVYKLAGAGAGLLLLAGLFFTPAGRVLAEEIIQFFNQITGNTFPLAADERLEEIPAVTPQPTYFPEIVPADEVEPAPAEAVTPAPTRQLDPQVLADLDAMTARSLAGFALLEPARLPDGYRLSNIRFEDDQDAVVFTYNAENAHFTLTEAKRLLALDVPEDAMQETLSESGLRINMTAFPQNAAEEADTILSWQQDGVDLRLEIFGGSQSEVIDVPQKWLDVIADLTACPPANGSNDYACEVGRAMAAAGFDAWQFSEAPEGYAFKNANYSMGQTAIWYASPAGELGLLQSTTDFKTQETSEWFAVPDEAIQEVSVLGEPAEYVNGSFSAQPGADHAIWNPDSGQIRLRWKQDEFWLQFVKWGAPAMQPQELADLAADLTDDPQAVRAEAQGSAMELQATAPALTMAEAREAYGPGFLQPASLPQGLPFSHARLEADGTLLMLYGAFAENKQQALGDILMFAQGSLDSTLGEAYTQDFPPQAITDTQVNGQPAKLIRGTLQTSYDENGRLVEESVWKSDPNMLSLYWEVDQHDYILRFIAGVGSGTRLDEAALVAIAESLE